MFEQLPLRDIHLPDPVSWWPLAGGWWALLALLLAAVLGGLWLRRVWRPRAQRRRLRQLVEAELASIESQYRTRGDAAELARALSVWLRRAAMTLHGRSLAGLSGDDWTAWLARHGGGFDNAAAALLRSAPYRRSGDGQQATLLLAACRVWLEKSAR